MAETAAKILVTCTSPRAENIVADLDKEGIKAMGVPALEVQYIDTPCPKGPFDAILLTSPHTLHFDLPDLPVIAVGEETAHKARDKGLYVMHTGSKGIDDIDLLAYSCLLYPCAVEPSSIPDQTIAWHVYETVPNTNFHIPDSIETVCVFSKKGADVILPHCHERHSVIALSHAIADIFHSHRLRNLVVCDAPRYDVMKQILMDKDVQA